MKKNIILVLCTVSSIAILGSIYASGTTYTNHHQNPKSEHSENDSSTDHHEGFSTIAGGQAAFSEISRLVKQLSEDPFTDWGKVNITALRDHLVDMNNVTLYADVTAKALPTGAAFTVTSSNAKVIASIQRMVSAHAASMVREGDNVWQVELRNDGALINVTSDEPANSIRILPLGFHGLMAMGDHHTHHHHVLALGDDPH